MRIKYDKDKSTHPYKFFFSRATHFSRLKKEKMDGKENTLSELYRAWDGGTHSTTMKGAARRIQCFHDMWCSSNRRHCKHGRLPHVGACDACANNLFFLKKLFYANIKLSLISYNINEKNIIKRPKNLSILAKDNVSQITLK
jgi:hypothetical protein